MSEREVTRLVTVEGLVQGVGYREFTRRAAQRLSVSGWVRNRSNGTVEALLHGPPDVVAALIAEMRRGPRGASVSGVRDLPTDECGDFEPVGFYVRSTS